MTDPYPCPMPCDHLLTGGFEEVKCCFIYCTFYVGSSSLRAVGDFVTFVQSIKTDANVSCRYIAFLRVFIDEKWTSENLMESIF